ncbi:UNVERIFIED_CONTAM: hypothetical protein Sradi_6372700 [Sesamum radiatum]|uniref:Tf2-1-like SH3-like domain-containing protein n=1 Tax=Sesamum radiatum TaxID=300843 RepID=A0AAW2K293_SESRA
MCHLRPSQWHKWLSLAEYWYNTNFHTGLKLTPFQALYGYVPGPLTIDPYIPTSQPEVREYLQERARMLEVMRVQLRRNMKLAPKYYGPFRILAKIGPVAYRLALPPTSGIHPVFHVSLLKKKIGHKHTPTLNLPIFDQHGFCKVYPSQILARRLISRRNDPVPQVLVQWINYGPSEATWEDYYDLVARFPDFNMDRGGPGTARNCCAWLSMWSGAAVAETASKLLCVTRVEGLIHKDAGVDIDEENNQDGSPNWRFGLPFEYGDSNLVADTDEVETKLETGIHQTIGLDLANDVYASFLQLSASDPSFTSTLVW